MIKVTGKVGTVFGYYRLEIHMCILFCAATELQTWFLFYSVPILDGILPRPYNYIYILFTIANWYRVYLFFWDLILLQDYWMLLSPLWKIFIKIWKNIMVWLCTVGWILISVHADCYSILYGRKLYYGDDWFNLIIIILLFWWFCGPLNNERHYLVN